MWRKGESSGCIQDLLQIDFDCDADALRYRVIQRGEPAAFCHKGDRGCWGPDSGLTHLQRVLHERVSASPEGSYTKRLLDDPVMLRNKLLEEAQVSNHDRNPHVFAINYAAGAC